MISFKSGTSHNSVPPLATAILRAADKEILVQKMKLIAAENSFNCSFSTIDDCLEIRVFGKSVHGSIPEQGINAAMQLVILLNGLNLGGDIGELITFLATSIGLSTNGEYFSPGDVDDFGERTLNVGSIEINENLARVLVDTRCPVTGNNDVFMDKLYAEAELFSFEIQIDRNEPPLYFDPDNEMIQSMLEVYHVFENKDAVPIAIGGGTYAKTIPNLVAFGPVFPDMENLCHQPNEYVELKRLRQMMSIYANALYKLAN